MQLREIMTHDVQCLAPSASIREAAELMKDGDFGSVPICENDRLVGIVTDRDIVIRGIADGASADTPLSQVMSSRMCFAFEDQSIEEAAELMEERQIRRLPILDRSKRLVGIVSLGDIAVEVQRDELSGEVLERISEPSHA